jgi:energy-coupling factor transport system ATP-binding protein
MEVVSRYFDRVIVLKEGEIVFDGKKTDLLKKDDLYEKYSLDYPETIKILRAIKERFGVDIDVNQHSVEDAYREIRKAFARS